MTRITTIGFDADDTLWHNERNFKLTESRFAELLHGYGETAQLLERLVEAERRNIGHYGFGVKGFTLSMIETAIEVTDGKVPASVISEILATGRDMLAHPVECFPGVVETLERLKPGYRLLMITRGDLFDQERKLAASGLEHLFDAVEIVSDKHAPAYDRIFSAHGDGAERAVMVGNSLKSDIVPALEAGCRAIHVPHEHEWVLEQAVAPEADGRFHRAADIREVPEIVSEWIQGTDLGL